MKVQRNAITVCADVAYLLKAETAWIPVLVDELAFNPNVNEDIVRDRLSSHGAPADRIESFIGLYRERKAGK